MKQSDRNSKKKERMNRRIGIGFALVLLGGFVAYGLIKQGSPKPAPAKTTTSQPQAQNPALKPSVPFIKPTPPFHKSAEAAKPFPKLLSAAYFRQYPLVVQAYKIAAAIPEVLAQQPCYCYCDRFGHGSLLDCYASDHGAG